MLIVDHSAPKINTYVVQLFLIRYYILRYLYSEQIPDTEGEVTDLLIIADKYLISRLKRRCEEVGKLTN